MDITLALQRAVRGFALGSEALAARLGMSVHTLNHKVSPTYEGAACSVEEAAEICEVTGDMGPLHAFAASLQHVALPSPEPAEGGDATALQLATTVREFSEFLGEVSGAIADHRITTNELGRIEREAVGAITAINKLVTLARRMHDSSRPEASTVSPLRRPGAAA